MMNRPNRLECTADGRTAAGREGRASLAGRTRALPNPKPEWRVSLSINPMNKNHPKPDSIAYLHHGIFECYLLAGGSDSSGSA